METNQKQRILSILNEVERKNLQRINGELTEYIRRQSYEFSEKDRAAVANVLLRSIEKLAGKRGMKTVTEQYEGNVK